MTKRQVLHIVWIAASILACIWAVLALACALYAGSSRLALVQFTNAVSAFVPSAWRGTYVVALPTGGSLRGDFLITAVVFAGIATLVRHFWKRI